MKLGSLSLDPSIPPYLIAEIGLCHNGNYDLAQQLIYQSYLSGASIIKLQKRSPATLMTSEMLDRQFLKFPTVGDNQSTVRSFVELDFEAYTKLFDYAHSLGLKTCATAFDLESLDFLSQLNCDFIKIASHSASNIILINKVISLNLPFFISLGALKNHEKFFLLQNILPKDNCAVFHCVSEYPSSPSNQFLDSILEIQHHDFISGFSTHEKGYTASMIASFLGARFIERHITLSNVSVGFDHSISMEPSVFAEMAMAIKDVFKMKGVKDTIINQELPARHNYHSGLYYCSSYPAGHKININNLEARQPLGDSTNALTGIEFEQIKDKILAVDVKAGEQLLKTHFKILD